VARPPPRQQPQEFLEWNALMEKMSALAVKAGIDKSSPYADRLAWQRAQILRQAAFEQKPKEFAPTDAVVKATFDANPLQFATMHAKILFVAEHPGREAEAKAKLERALADLKANKPFAAVVKQHSDYKADGDFPPIAGDSKLPLALRQSIYKTKPGMATAPYHVPGQGHYIFRVEKIDQMPMAEIRDQIRRATGEAKFKEWLDKVRESSSVAVLNLRFFTSLSRLMGITPPPEASKEEVKPESPLATINGKTFTAKDYTELMKAVSPNLRANATSQPLDFLNQYALLLRIAEAAEKEGLDKKQPYAGRLMYDRQQILMQGYVDQHMNGIVIMPDEQKKAFEAVPGRFSFAKVKVLYVSYSLTPPPQTDPNAPKILNEQEARAKAEEIAKAIRGGADFVSMVKRFSDDADSRARDGDGPTITATDPNIPDLIKLPVLAAKRGDVVGPVKLPNGFYLLRVEEISSKTYEQVKDQIYDEIRQERFNAWFDAQKQGLTAKITDPATFRRVVDEAGN
jgi:parvulin-like peptidyl-prolyl isomerase